VTRKRDVERPYPPEYVSADTLAYLLDYSRSTVDDYVRRGLLPKALTVGTNARWHWPTVVTFIEQHNAVATNPQTAPPSEDDVYLRGAKRAAASHA
jgi:predicted DNA-binding transcriptional regulator AlpA